jgi:hypothetical protein
MRHMSASCGEALRRDRCRAHARAWFLACPGACADGPLASARPYKDERTAALAGSLPPGSPKRPRTCCCGDQKVARAGGARNAEPSEANRIATVVACARPLAALLSGCHRLDEQQQRGLLTEPRRGPRAGSPAPVLWFSYDVLCHLPRERKTEPDVCLCTHDRQTHSSSRREPSQRLCVATK